MRKKVIFALCLFIFSLGIVLASCDRQEMDSTDNAIAPTIDFDDDSTPPIDIAEDIRILGDYTYPENPAEQLRSALEKDTNERGLSIKISAVERIEFDGKDCSQFKITFSDGNENMCIISFTNKHLEYGYDESLDGHNNPSFSIVFKEPDNSQDMVTVLTSVIKYLSPDLSFEEAKRLATKQDETISTDGYSMPQDIGGYQVQARYTNPHVFVRTSDFNSMFGVKVTALTQIWMGSIDTRCFLELKTAEDYNLLTKEYPYWEETEEPEYIYSDFVVKNIWQDQSYLHGETWVVVDLESVTGQQYSLSLDTWEFPKGYEFGVGQQYTVYIRRYPRRGIIYAVQQSEAAQFNSRGNVQPIDYPTDDWENRLWRVEPEGKGTVYDVCFILQSQGYGERFAASEGHGIGEKQWPRDPARDGYTFAGWYDNLEWNGNPYTKDTPIYEDTYLYATWKYSGTGGIWPRPRRGGIQGIVDGCTLSVGQKPTITVEGYNINLESPKDQRFRWMPATWRLSDGTRGAFSTKTPFQTNLPLDNKGEERLYITYWEEIFDGIDWQKTGQLREVEEAKFQIG